MADTKRIVAKTVTICVPCPRKSALKRGPDGKVIAGEYEAVELKHIEPLTPFTIDAVEADRLIDLGLAEEVKSEPAKAGK